ncbi:hypothetical protein N399_01125 [Bacillus licheniformis CG-B52]|nr:MULTISPECIES: DUF692 family multinuclear iron-containing protein [Bacillus]EQM25163.1 hypothetical protein N399_01125 [Bacillus licheniformis CG-B52]MDH3165131.1 DUF692 family protein [Bacillus licheniformis]
MSNCIGVGLSFRQNFFKDLDVIKQDVDFLEIISERYFDKKNEEELNTIRNYFPLIPHGLSLSIGTYEPLSKKRKNKYPICWQNYKLIAIQII